MRGVLLPIRLYQDTKTRKKTRPTKIKAAFKDIKGKREVSLDAKAASMLTAVWRLPLAGYYYNSLPHYHRSMFHWPYPIINQPLLKATMDRRRGKETTDPNNDWSYEAAFSRNDMDFFRMIAKIAHCTVIFYRGLDGFEPFLIPIIIGGSFDISRFVGFPNMPTEQLIELFEPMMLLKRMHNTLVATRNIHGKNVVVCIIKLFADSPMSCYEVLVGLDTRPDD